MASSFRIKFHYCLGIFIIIYDINNNFLLPLLVLVPLFKLEIFAKMPKLVLLIFSMYGSGQATISTAGSALMLLHIGFPLSDQILHFALTSNHEFMLQKVGFQFY